MRISSGTRAGRGHRRRDVPCQDSVAVWESPDGGRAAAAVADGLGSKPLSHHGSKAACEAAVASLAAEPAGSWDEAALVRAFEAARVAVQAAADGRQVTLQDLATTLQVATLDRADGRVLAGMVGDGAIVAHVAGQGGAAEHGDAVRVLLAPAEGGYANEVTPVTDPLWRDDLRLGQADGARSVLLFTDGLTRLLLARSRAGWQPFSPFFQAFLPQLAAAGFDDSLVAAFLGGDAVDRSWDDDKGLVAVALDPTDAAPPQPPAGPQPQASAQPHSDPLAVLPEAPDA
jgi:hypothetical protein